MKVMKDSDMRKDVIWRPTSFSKRFKICSNIKTLLPGKSSQTIENYRLFFDICMNYVLHNNRMNHTGEIIFKLYACR